jgi:hypothetical protein
MYSASHEVTHIVWNRKFHHCARHSLPFVPILSQIIQLATSNPTYLLCSFYSLVLLLPLRLEYLPQTPFPHPICYAVNVRTNFTSTGRSNIQHCVSVYFDLGYVRYLTKKTKASGPNCGRHSRNLICFWFLRASDFYLLIPFPNILNLLHVRKMS